MDLSRRIYEASFLTGDFTLRSGQTSHFYIDKYRFESDPNLLRDIVQAMAAQLPNEVELLAGLELGGIPIATALSLETGIPVIFVRKQAKPYGTMRIAEGVDFSSRRICIVEDVISTGGQVLESAQALRNEGGLVDWVSYVVSRGNETDCLSQAKLIPIPLLTIDEIAPI